MPEPGWPRADDTILTLIDVQQRFVPAMADFWPALRNMRKLIRGFGILEAPVTATEQYRKGLGPTIPSLQRLLTDEVPDKLAFSCYGCEEFGARVRDFGTVVLCGIEAHVCVLQTALDALAAGQTCYVVGDAVTSRRAADRALGLRQAETAGAVICATESLLFGMLREAGTEPFRRISRLVK